MPTGKTPQYYLAIPATEVNKAHSSHVMDMLRYDNAQVIAERLGCYILLATHPHSVERWRSFGIVPATSGMDWDPYELDKEIRQSPLVNLTPGGAT